MFGKKCKVCEEKDKRIQDLKEQLQAYRDVLNPPPRINKYELEETAVLNGGGQEIDPARVLQEELQAEVLRQEVDNILSGNIPEVPLPKEESETTDWF